MRTLVTGLLFAPMLALASVPGASIPPAASTSETTHAVAANKAVGSSWQPEPWSRYEGILQRMPFGKPPPALDPAAAAAAAAAAVPPPPPAFLNQLVLCAINRRPTGMVAVGFVDNSQKPPQSYYMDCGETEDGFRVVKADYLAESATISKEGVSVDLILGKGASAAPVPAPAALPTPAGNVPPPPSPAVPPVPRAPASLVPPSIFSAEGLPLPRSRKALEAIMKMGITNQVFLDRIQQRMDELQGQGDTSDHFANPETEEKFITGFESMLRRRNMDMIRKSGSGLGIPLTPEEGAQLTSEGVLPAQ